MQEDVPVPVSITAYTDKTFTYVRSTPVPLLLGSPLCPWCA